MSKIYQIAIDGPAGSGKSTIAKALALKLNIDYIDTGAMYRAFGYKIREKGIDMHNPQELQKLLDDTDIDFDKGKTLLDGEDVSGLIRTPEISMLASDCSAIAEVRKKLVKLQQAMGQHKSVVMDGRDIGTVVFPRARYKFFLTASDEERARRRYEEMLSKGEAADFDTVLREMRARDHQDTTREVTPLRQAEDAVLVDTTSMNITEVTEYIMNLIEEDN